MHSFVRSIGSGHARARAPSDLELNVNEAHPGAETHYEREGCLYFSTGCPIVSQLAALNGAELSLPSLPAPVLVTYDSVKVPWDSGSSLDAAHLSFLPVGLASNFDVLIAGLLVLGAEEASTVSRQPCAKLGELRLQSSDLFRIHIGLSDNFGHVCWVG